MPANDKYRGNYDRIFKRIFKKKDEPKQLVKKAKNAHIR